MLIKNHTFDAVERNYRLRADQDQGKRQTDASGEPIGCKWVYRRKNNPDRSTWYKVQLVTKGYAQKEGIDYDET